VRVESDRDPPEDLLARFGVPSSAEHVWRALMANPGVTGAEISALTGLDDEQVASAIATLAASQLVRTADAPTGAVAIDPTLAVETHIVRAERQLAEQAEELAKLRAQIPGLAADYARGRAAAGDQPGFEIVTGLESVRRQLDIAAEAATDASRSIYYSATLSALIRATSTDTAMLRHGVTQMSIVPSDALEDPRFYAELAQRSRNGELIRTLPATPTRLLIFGRDIAVLPLDPADLSLGAMFIRVDGLVDLLIFLFDQLWTTATPLFVPALGADAPSGRTARVLELLAAGTKDERIARTIGVGVRTIRRDIADLKDSLGVASRAELVGAAIRRGWL
jgi:DNA-binding CsgD family transcriptional regulator